jgi:hypothetical protein
LRAFITSRVNFFGIQRQVDCKLPGSPLWVILQM